MVEGKAASTDKSILGKSEFKDGKLGSFDPAAQPPKCPECASQKVWKDGIRYTKQGDVQRYLCRSCGYRFSQPNVKVQITGQTRAFHSSFNLTQPTMRKRNLSLKKQLNDSALSLGKDVGSHTVTVVGKRLNNLRSYNSKRRVCETDGVLKNLVKVETRLKRAAGATKTTKPDPETVKGLIVQYAYWLEKEGYYTEDSAYLKLIRRLARVGTNLLDPEHVKSMIAKQPWRDGTKLLATYAYDVMTKMLGIKWTRPKYKPEERLPWIPEEAELDALIASCRSRRMATFLQTLKETFADPGEALRIRWIDVNDSNNTITINRPVKGHNPRQLKVSSKLIAMLNALPKTSERIFPTTYRSMVTSYMRVRARAAQKLQNPRLLSISFTTFRHWGATMTYHYTRKILLVQKLLGHKHIQNTMVYTQLVQFKDDEFDVETATTVEEAKTLLKAGFDYIAEKDGIMLFRRPQKFARLTATNEA